MTNEDDPTTIRITISMHIPPLPKSKKRRIRKKWHKRVMSTMRFDTTIEDRKHKKQGH